DFRRAATRAGDEELVVVLAPGHALHDDVDGGVVGVELPDHAEHRPPVRAGEAVPEAQLDDGLLRRGLITTREHEDRDDQQPAHDVYLPCGGKLALIAACDEHHATTMKKKS